MNYDETRMAVEGVIYLCGCVVNGKIPKPERIDSINLDDLYVIANRHMITAMTGIALQQAGINDSKFNLAVAAAQRKIIILNEEKRLVFEKLDEAGIWHMALKGTVIRDWYPKFGMRESVDCDILFDKEHEEKVRDIMIGLGYTVESYGHGHHDVYFKKPLTNMQMHVALFGTGFEKRLNDYYANVIKRLEGLGYEKHFIPEDFYIYVLAHNHRDYTNGGSGIRSLLDTYVILKRFDFRWEYIIKETEKLGIRQFEEENRSLALHLFSGKELTDTDKSRLDYMIGSGVFGTVENAVNNKIDEYGGGLNGKVRYLFNRLILPMDVVKKSFPIFYKYKLLLPILPLYRLVKGVTTNRKKLKTELKSLRSHKK